MRLQSWIIDRPIRLNQERPWVWPTWWRVYTGGWRIEVGPIAVEYVPQAKSDD